jgi:phospholipid N-methyltransferase
MKPGSTLIVFELHDDFFNKLKEEFKDNPSVIIKNESAENIGLALKEANLSSTDYVISSLPLANFPSDLIEAILANSVKYLASTGKYVQFQYSLTSKKHLQRNFNSIQISFTARNIPPAFVYTCSNTSKID